MHLAYQPVWISLWRDAFTFVWCHCMILYGRWHSTALRYVLTIRTVLTYGMLQMMTTYLLTYLMNEFVCCWLQSWWKCSVVCFTVCSLTQLSRQKLCVCWSLASRSISALQPHCSVPPCPSSSLQRGYVSLLSGFSQLSLDFLGHCVQELSVLISHSCILINFSWSMSISKWHKCGIVTVRIYMSKAHSICNSLYLW